MHTDLQKLEELLEEFSTLTDTNERADLLIEYAEGFSQVPATVASPPYPESLRVPGCESEVFLFTVPKVEGQGFQFFFGIENPQGISAMALAAILDETLSGASKEALREVDEGFVHSLFGKQLSMGKGQGLTNMVLMCKAAGKESIT